MNLLRGIKLKKTLATTHEASSKIYVPQYFKPKIKKVCHNTQYFLLLELPFDICICSNSGAAKFATRNELEWR